ncbi:dTDP-4-dehydrorhamnose reductase [Herbinix hemicellulosilytica]|uniref:dTDP-4-dehydrorhamnose reductase n=1 Tax=Herbinix hemicellulosilytica TaxID=1564487 RepID=A0A0H5SF52_HERHM|nr:SDR family oxidoreductase [Herbinix hemicellulosilytica]RBP58390.1 dTDP-4-dehydrorhamnose reductase [Herbinix hemicellulosilytica]CRZ34107.1 hypothetical protein HHT355_0904 [Herbinix hemicellulosilytica]
MKILIIGATGMAGHMISMYFIKTGHEVTALSRKKFSYCKNIIADITDFSILRGIIEAGDYDAVINAVGILNQEAEKNKPLAVLLNSYLPHFLSDITENIKTKVIHLSTDCVFSGKTGGYNENSLPDGTDFYSESKALGELNDEKNLTFRTSIIGPDPDENGIGLFNWFMKQEGTVKGYTKVIWTGVTTLTMAKAAERALIENITGLYHLVNNCPISKYNLLKMFNKHVRNGQLDIIPFDTENVNKSLVNTRTDFSFKVPDYETMIIEMKEWILNHKELYPHYQII